jgi:hypothetical protein
MTNHAFTPASVTFTNLQANQIAGNFTAAAAYAISGRITKGGVALAGAAVNLTGGITMTKLTDATGAFSFTGLPAGLNYVVKPSMTNHLFTPTSLTYNNLQANQTAANFTTVAAYAISGRITKGGVALAGVTVNLTGGNTGIRTTDAAGAFWFTGLRAGGSYAVTPVMTNHVFTPRSYTFNNLQANQTANFIAAPAYLISGRITKGGVALVGVTVNLTGGNTGTRTTDAAGAFSFTGLRAGGSYAVTPVMTNNAFTPPSVTFMNLQANQTAADFIAVAAYAISGRITKGAVALAGVAVNLTGGRTMTKLTDATGAFSFTGLPAGLNYVVKPSMTNHLFTPTSLTYINLQAHQATANFTAVAAYAISGRIIKGGVAWAGVTVAQTGTKDMTRVTDASSLSFQSTRHQKEKSVR